MINLLKKTFFAVTVLMLFFVGIQHVSAASIVVNANADNQTGGDGFCTLREAITNANSNTDTTSGDCIAGSGTDTITFDSAMTIQVLSNMAITSPMVIDGTSGGTIGTCTTKSLGVVLDGSLGVVVDPFNIEVGGSGTTIKGFVIQNMDHGINISSSDNNIIQCNMFGLNQAGTALAENALGGVYIGGGSTGNMIGGLNPGDGNIISGNTIGIIVVESNDTEIYGNMIGLNLAGDAGFLAQKVGIEISNSDGTIIGGSSTAHRNIISGSQNDSNSSGLNIDGLSDNTTIQGNYFGTDSTGLVSISSNNKNIEICDHSGCTGFDVGAISGIVIGGANAGEGNIFGPTSSGTGGNAINTSASFGISDVSIKGNVFGIGSDGTTLLGGSPAGWIFGDGVSTLVIGGSGENEGNIFSANNSQQAVSISGGSGAVINGNIIGLLADGVTETGAFTDNAINASEVNGLTIGIPVTGGGNIISGIELGGSLINISSNQDMSIQNNRIGVDLLNTVLSNAGTGIFMGGNEGGVIGGFGLNEGNMIAGFDSFGITSLLATTEIKGNTIFNNRTGILFGGTAIVPVDVSGPALRNSMYGNDIGIDIAYDSDENTLPDTFLGPNSNDYLDADTGPNNYINHPVLISATQNGSDVDITYMLDVPVSVNPYHIEFFSNPSGLDASGFGQGEIYEDSDEQTIVSAGPQIFTATIANATAANGITATVTDCTNIGCTTFGGTSEFSNGITGTGAGIDMATASGSQTVLVDNGPYHIIKTGVHLGATIGSDTVGSVDASDKDGVTFDAATYAPGATVTATVTASTDGYISAWIDADANGTFETQMFSVLNEVTTGSNTFTFIAPSSAGTYNVRFRYTDYAPTDLDSTGEALNGEVEDYIITVEATTVTTQSSSGRIPPAVWTAPTSSNSVTDSSTCPADQILTQNMRAGARNGKYHNYTKAIVKEVKILQAHMNRLGFKSGPVDGILGKITDGAIKRMQTFLGTKADGYIGPLTRALINKSCGNGGLQKVL